MPPLIGFSGNRFQTREDVITAIFALVRPLIPYFSPQKARIRLPVATGTHFDESAAQLEGFARPLWAIGALLACLPGLRAQNSTLVSEIEDITKHWVEGIVAGTDPDSVEYWGDIGPIDQRMVEAEIIAFALLSAPEVMFHGQNERVRSNITDWLRGMNGKPMPDNNWRWFRVFANLALIEVCGVPIQEVHGEMESDFAILDSFYLHDGWSADGSWLSSDEETASENLFDRTGRRDQTGPGRHADYYSGSFAIQFSQLLYTKFGKHLEPERARRYEQQAREFGTSFWRYFDSDGAAIPFGRSLTYRFACGGFFGALAMANIPDMMETLSLRGSVKGFLLRHLRWWAKHSEDIFYPDGTMNIGWLYPNMYMSEDYNSPQSVYWCLKTLIAVASDDQFWASEEEAYPRELFRHTLVSAPKQILVNHPEAPDNTLALSRDGAETWAVKWKCSEATFSTIDFKNTSKPEKITVASVKWSPWSDRQVEVQTTLIPPTDRWPDWHIRVHRIRVKSHINTLHAVEGGFAVSGRHARDGTSLQILGHAVDDMTEGIIQDSTSVLIMSPSGLSGIVSRPHRRENSGQDSYALKPDANTNLAYQRTLIPITTLDIAVGLDAGHEVILVTKVFAITKYANGERKLPGDAIARWLDKPKLQFSNGCLQV
ncbi:hypothetical protein BKA67DRAFT_213840 [Truncatella angustata]|uniref:Uncharacterized protein n=1 Tax=Truncatella angustata TaxID=152316 RepID=A0A9P8UUE6_9PEZI|nr:uncharacterized protein BKA67DRAFT_213840 [Truncatella angustata]KAH6658418.1 hypothetical protein BKA67DRAFT_213840 [Truncatella angustata]